MARRCTQQRDGTSSIGDGGRDQCIFRVPSRGPADTQPFLRFERHVYCAYVLAPVHVDARSQSGCHWYWLRTLRVSSYCQPSLSSPLDGMQANGKPLVSSTHAQTTTMVHGPDGPTRGRAEAMWGWRQNRSSKAGKVLHMRSHEACCFSMMRTNVPDALVAMG